jgi:hypothetical protein
MAVTYKLVGFDRKTERLAVAHEIPAECVSQAKELAGIANNPAIIADWPLSAAQAAAIAQLIGEPIDPARYEYTLEPYSQRSSGVGDARKLHTITGVKMYDAGRLLLRFDDDDRAELTDLVDLSAMLAQGGVFEPLRDPNRFIAVEIGPRGRSVVWHVGEDVVDLSADALWLMAHPHTAR